MFEDIFSIFQYVLALSNLNISTLHIQMDLQSSEVDLGQELHWWHYSQKCVGLVCPPQLPYQIQQKNLIPDLNNDFVH